MISLRSVFVTLSSDRSRSFRFEAPHFVLRREINKEKLEAAGHSSCGPETR